MATTSMARPPAGTAVLALLWWSWVGHAWSATRCRRRRAGPGRDVRRDAAMFVMAVTVPEAFNDLDHGSTGRPSSRSPTRGPGAVPRDVLCAVGRRPGSCECRSGSLLLRSSAVPGAAGGVAAGRMDRTLRGRGADRGLLRHDPGGRVGLEALLGLVLRRAARPHPDRRAGSVDRGDRRRRGGHADSRPIIVASIFGPTVAGVVVGVLLRRLDRGRAAAPASGGRGTSALPAMPTATWTCR